MAFRLTRWKSAGLAEAFVLALSAGWLNSGCSSAPQGHPPGRLSSPVEIAPMDAPFPMPQLTAPVFPDHTENILRHGAVRDGKSKNTQAFAEAIRACAAAGGGRVLVPAGR